jgi:hypothetical protein
MVCKRILLTLFFLLTTSNTQAYGLSKEKEYCLSIINDETVTHEQKIEAKINLARLHCSTETFGLCKCLKDAATLYEELLGGQLSIDQRHDVRLELAHILCGITTDSYDWGLPSLDYLRAIALYQESISDESITLAKRCTAKFYLAALYGGFMGTLPVRNSRKAQALFTELYQETAMKKHDAALYNTIVRCLGIVHQSLYEKNKQGTENQPASDHLEQAIALYKEALEFNNISTREKHYTQVSLAQLYIRYATEHAPQGVMILRELQKLQDTLSKDLQDTILALLDEAKDVVVPEEVATTPQAQEPVVEEKAAPAIPVPAVISTQNSSSDDDSVLIAFLFGAGMGSLLIYLKS